MLPHRLLQLLELEHAVEEPIPETVREEGRQGPDHGRLLAEPVPGAGMGFGDLSDDAGCIFGWGDGVCLDASA